MTTTLNHDEFEYRPHAHSYGDPFVTHIVYGAKGWTDLLERTEITLLVEAGVIVLDRTVAGPGWQTHLYRSLDGVIPLVDHE